MNQRELKVCLRFLKMGPWVSYFLSLWGHNCVGTMLSLSVHHFSHWTNLVNTCYLLGSALSLL